MAAEIRLAETTITVPVALTVWDVALPASRAADSFATVSVGAWTLL